MVYINHGKFYELCKPQNAKILWVMYIIRQDDKSENLS